MHTLGLSANYLLSQRLQDALSGYGLSVQKLRGDRYELISDQASFSMDAICPDTIHRDGNVFNLDGVQKVAEFLHQPIRSSLDEDVPAVDYAMELDERLRKQRHRKEAIHEDRTTAHRLLRFATTGSVEISDHYHDEDCSDHTCTHSDHANDHSHAHSHEHHDHGHAHHKHPAESAPEHKESCECHAETEEAMRNDDIWRNDLELGSSEEGVASIPRTSFDPQRGFIFNISKKHADFPGAQQGALFSSFWQLVNDATNDRYPEPVSEVVLSADELKRVATLSKGRNLDDLIQDVEFEEAIQEKLASIQRHTKVVSLKTTDPEQDRKRQLQELMHASSSLKPFVTGDYMSEGWARYNFMERHKSPAEGLGKEIAIFLAISELYAAQDHISDAQMEAIAREFQSLISFSGQTLRAVEDGLEKEILKNPEAEHLFKELAQSALMRQRFEEASVAGTGVNAAFLSDEQRDFITTLRKKADRPRTFFGGVKHRLGLPFHAGAVTTIDFAKDVINFIKEDPRIATSYVIAAGTLYSMNSEQSPQEQQEAAKNTALEIGDDGEFLDVPANGENVPLDLFGDESFHWDLRITMEGYEMYKHFANSNFIVGPSQNVMEGVRSTVHSAYADMGIPQNLDSSFDTTANAVATPLANRLFDVNMFQNFSHVAFWMWTFSKGWNNGFKGFERIFELAGPVVNLGYQAGAATADQFRDVTKLSEELARLRQDGQTAQFKYESKAKHEGLVDALHDASEARSEVEATLPQPLDELHGTLHINGFGKDKKRDSLTREFTISANNAKPVLEAIEKFDYFMAYSASALLAEESWHTRTLLPRIRKLQQAMLTYVETNDAKALDSALEEHLEYVAASELRYRGGKSEIYNALFEAAPDKAAFKRLMRTAKSNIGIERREHRKDEKRALIRGEAGDSLTLAGHGVNRAKIGGYQLWGGIVGSFKGIRRVTDRTINKRNIAITAGVAAACSGIDLALTPEQLVDAMSGYTGKLPAEAASKFVSGVSGLTGGAAMSSVVTTFFLGYNFVEDIVGVHVGTGLALLGTGAVAGKAYKHAFRPAAIAGLEVNRNHVVPFLNETGIGQGLTKAWQATGGEVYRIGIKPPVDFAIWVYEGGKQANIDLGKLLTKQAQERHVALDLA